MVGINTPTGKDGEKKTTIQSLTGKSKDEISEILYWDKMAILEDLKKNHVSVNKTRYMWYQWKEIHIELPEVWECDFFVSDKAVTNDVFRCNWELHVLSHTEHQMQKLLEKIDKYMQHFGVDINNKYNPVPSPWEPSNMWECLLYITWLNEKPDSSYRLQNRCIEWKEQIRAIWNFGVSNSCDRYYKRFYDNPSCYLFLRCK